MSTSPINNLTSTYLQSILGSTLQDAGLTTTKSSNSASPNALQPDQSSLSPFAQLLSTLQQLQQSDPTKYQQVTQQIATNLQSAAQTAQSDGNTTAANQLNQLSTDFTNASQSSQLPSIQDLAKAIGGGHHHHHHHAEAASADSDATSSTTSSFSTASSGDPLNPANIILNTLSNAGINGSNSNG